MSAGRDPGAGGDGRTLVDFGALAGRVGVAAIVLGVLAFVGVVVQGLGDGLTFALMMRWAAAFLAALLTTTAVLVAVSALRGADRAQRRGERLTSRDVKLLPPRRRGEDPGEG